MRKFLGPVIVAGAALLGTVLPGAVLPAFADPNLPTIAPHRHFILMPTGEQVEVGPRLCDNLSDPVLQNAFNQFHVNLHRSVAGSLGPQAPGLHNGEGAELVAQRTC